RSRSGSNIMRRIVPALFTVAVFALVFLSDRYGTDPTEAGGPAGADEAVVMPANLAGMLITFGAKDQEVTVWDGEISTSAGKIVAMDVSGGNAKKSSAKNGKFNLKSAFNKKAPKKSESAALRV